LSSCLSIACLSYRDHRYLLSFPTRRSSDLIFILIFFFLPKGEVQAPLEHNSKVKLPLAVWGYALAMGGIMLAYYSVATNMALFLDRKSTRLNSSHVSISYAVFCLKKKIFLF